VTLHPARIRHALNDEDPENLLKLGAPDDEYQTEADMIANLLANVPPADRTLERVVAIIAGVWRHMFALSPEALKVRGSMFQRVAERILR